MMPLLKGEKPPPSFPGGLGDAKQVLVGSQEEGTARDGRGGEHRFPQIVGPQNMRLVADLHNRRQTRLVHQIQLVVGQDG